MTNTRMDPQFYRSHGPVTDPGALANLFDDLPDDVEGIVKSVQRLLVHIFWAKRYGVVPDKSQEQHVQSRHVTRILSTILDACPDPLSVERPLEKRFFGNCRDFSVLTASILRHKGIPARARCGFATYFWPGKEKYEDHWVFEYMAGDRWVTADAQLDAYQCSVLKPPFDPMDMPPGQFLSGAEAWKLCRRGERDPQKFGIFDMHGLWFIRGNLIRELASLNKLEMLPWDVWGLMNQDMALMTAAEYELLDQAADLVLADDAGLRTLYLSQPEFQVPVEMLKAGIA